MQRFLHRLGSPVYELLCTWMEIGSLFLAVIAKLPRFSHYRWKEIRQIILVHGIGSLPIILISTVFAGLVITHEIAWHMNAALHTVSMIPGFTGQFILRELGIAIPALLLVSKVGASITAELGSMKVTEQIDALELLGIDRIDYLVFPRFLGLLISGACLALISVYVTLGFALLMAVIRYGFSALEYISILRHFIGMKDLVCALLKGAVFGGVIPVIACGYAFRCKPGAEGVGSATTEAVVGGTLSVIVLDFLLTYAFT